MMDLSANVVGSRDSVKSRVIKRKALVSGTQLKLKPSPSVKTAVKNVVFFPSGTEAAQM